MRRTSVGVDDGDGSGGAFEPCGAELRSDRRRQAGSPSAPGVWSWCLDICSHQVPSHIQVYLHNPLYTLRRDKQEWAASQSKHLPQRDPFQ
jgi:hypothetical protein